MSKVYLVLEREWGYNDEYYFMEEGHSVTSKAYPTREAAEQAAFEKTVYHCRNEINFGEYMWSQDGYGDTKAISDGLIAIFGQTALEADDDLYNFEIPKDATPEQLKKLAALLDDNGIEFFTVQEVEVELSNE